MDGRLFRRSVSYGLVEHCNLRCARCDHFSPWVGEGFAPLDGFVRDFTALTEVMAIDELRFSGGEPMMHPRFVDFLRVARERELSAGITVLSNGMLLHEMPAEVWTLIDALIVSQYPRARHRFDVDEVRRLASDHNVLFRIESELYFDQILLHREVEDPQWVESFYRGCYSAINCHTVHDGWYYRCSRAHTLETRMRLLGKEVANREVDGVALHDRDGDLRAALAAYLAVDEPLLACKFCLGSHGKAFPHEQLTKLGLQREMAETHDDVQALLKPDAALDPARVARAAESELGWWDVSKNIPANLATVHRAVGAADPLANSDD